MEGEFTIDYGKSKTAKPLKKAFNIDMWAGKSFGVTSIPSTERACTQIAASSHTSSPNTWSSVSGVGVGKEDGEGLSPGHRASSPGQSYPFPRVQGRAGDRTEIYHKWAFACGKSKGGMLGNVLPSSPDFQLPTTDTQTHRLRGT